MTTFKTLLSAATLALVLPLAAQAAVLKTATFDYGNGAGEVNPNGDDPVGSNFVRVRDTSTATGYAQFIQIFDFTDLAGATIDSIDVVLNYTGVGDEETWAARVLGSDNAVTSDDTFTGLVFTGPATSTLGFTISAASDLATSSSGFAESVALNQLRLRFREESFGDDDFRLFSATFAVNGTAAAPVPLPASGMLLLGALGGVAAIRRRRKAA
ncbi:MAG: VPLPA-CTERM sorting domain-containing protein [Aliishimia sp.]